jgi:hypothetical protein
VEAAIALVSVVVGFALAVAWDELKRRRDRKAALGRALSAIEQELKANIDLIAFDLHLLKEDDVAADKEQKVVRPLECFHTAVGDTMYMNGILELKSLEFASYVRNAYVSLAILNAHIEGRELYRMTNGAMSNFAKRRKIWNSELQSLLNANQVQLQDLSSKIRD